jgi:hypothetical protein
MRTLFSARCTIASPQAEPAALRRVARRWFRSSRGKPFRSPRHFPAAPGRQACLRHPRSDGGSPLSTTVASPRRRFVVIEPVAAPRGSAGDVPTINLPVATKAGQGTHGGNPLGVKTHGRRTQAAESGETRPLRPLYSVLANLKSIQGLLYSNSQNRSRPAPSGTDPAVGCLHSDLED